MSAQKLRVREGISVTLSGMTGFARVAGSASWGQWTWEARSVNGRNLDLRLNLPNGFEGLEGSIRKQAAAHFKRGNIQLSLRYVLTQSTEQVEINQEVLDTLVAAHETRLETPISGPALATLMGVKGVVAIASAQGSDLLQEAGAEAELSRSVSEVLAALHQARLTEGAELIGILRDQLATMQSLCETANGQAGEQTETIRKRYRERIAELDIEQALTEDRFALEVALLAAKADVREELDRLKAHIDRGAALLENSEPIGRDLGFLAQELNREANTLCSKSAVLDLTNTGLALKSVIDQFKEQAANVE